MNTPNNCLVQGRVFGERKLSHRTLVKSQSLSFDSADVSPLHPTTLVSVQIYQDDSPSVVNSEASLTFQDAEITYKDKNAISTPTNTTPDNSTTTITTTSKDSVELRSTIPRYNGMARSVTFSGLATIKEESDEDMSEEDEIGQKCSGKTDVELDMSTTDIEVEVNESEDQISSSEEIQQTASESSSSETETETETDAEIEIEVEIEKEVPNVLNQAVGGTEEPIVVAEIKPPSPPTPKKVMQLTNAFRKPKMKR